MVDRVRMDRVIAKVAPGTPLRDALGRMLRAGRGALLVLGNGPELAPLLSGGFRIDAPFTPQRAAELSKMDGAIVLDEAADTIHWANVQLMPDPSIPTAESGTRHRTAERVARQTGLAVISVSASMKIVTLYVEGQRHVLSEVPTVLARANQALGVLERYRARFDQAVRVLNALELADQTTQRDVVLALARGELLHRLSRELDHILIELGTDGRLVALQSGELMSGVETERLLLVRDYHVPRAGQTANRALDAALLALAELPSADLLEPAAVAGALNLPRGPEELDAPVAPRGYRLLSKVPRLSSYAVRAIVARFGTLPRLMAAGPDELDDIEGVGANRAKAVREGLTRLADAGVDGRYV
jgi:diadenylate cyclase